MAIRAADEKPAARPIDFPRPVWYLNSILTLVFHTQFRIAAQEV